MTTPGSTALRQRRFWPALASLLAMMVLLGATTWWVVFRDPALSWDTPAGMVLLNAFPILCVALVSWAATRRLVLSLLRALPEQHPDRLNAQKLRTHLAWRDFSAPQHRPPAPTSAGGH